MDEFYCPVNDGSMETVAHTIHKLYALFRVDYKGAKHTSTHQSTIYSGNTFTISNSAHFWWMDA